VRAVLDGEIFTPPEAVAGDTFAQRAAQLTPQQWRVLGLMVQGDQNKVIAYKLGVGEATVKAHVTVILRKLGVRRELGGDRSPGLALPGDTIRGVRQRLPTQRFRFHRHAARGATPMITR
jgi:DNA-binding NarL/FixJ family response regulator